MQKAYAAAPKGAEVVRLADFPKRATSSNAAAAPRGEILLFTGIRYERQTEPTEPDPRDLDRGEGAARKPRRRKRRV
ncbi:MAG: hypothetical protein JJU21_06920 [Salinarimonas sp.]|nr:hypothetical protein [Salinarimonas sp.]